MDIVGGGKMHVYPSSDEYPHTKGDHEHWQESYVLHFYDLKQNLGGYFRIGHEPNCNGGTIALWSNIVTPEGMFHRAEDVKIAAGDITKNGFSADQGALAYHWDGKQITWSVKEKDITANFKLEDFHPAVDGYKRDGKVGDYAAAHVEVALRVTGTITAHGKTYDVDGLGIRDHGWGVRHWHAMLSHRWTVATFDKDNSFCAVAMHLTSDVIAKFGWVIRGDKVVYADKVDIVAKMEVDGTTHRGGTTTMTLTTGEIYTAHFTPITPCINSWIHGTDCVDNFSRVSWGDKVGVGCFETSNNMHAGTRRPAVFDGALSANGWYPTKK